jgi:hypothetical protein
MQRVRHDAQALSLQLSHRRGARRDPRRHRPVPQRRPRSAQQAPQLHSLGVGEEHERRRSRQDDGAQLRPRTGVHRQMFGGAHGDPAGQVRETPRVQLFGAERRRVGHQERLGGALSDTGVVRRNHEH